jgi:O-antigen/teichoic acid export membrane protein
MGRSYLTVVVCQALAAAAAIAGLRWLAVYVSPETFGQYALYQSVVSAGTLFLLSWPNAALVRFGREEWATHGRVGTTLAARVLLFGACLLVAFAIAWSLDPWLRTFLHVDQSPFRWIALGLVVTPVAELVVYLHQTVGRTEVYGYTPLITRVGFLIGVLLIPVFGTGRDWTYLALCISAATAVAAASAAAALPSSCWSEFRLDSRTIVKVLRYSWALPFAGISTYVVNWVDSWVIRGVKGVGSVGVYNWAYQTTVVAALAFAPIAVVLTPRMIDARLTGDSAGIKRYVDAIAPTATLMAAAVAVGLAFVFPMLRWVAGPAYAAAYPVILILLSALPFQLIAYLVTPLGNAYERVLPRFVLVSAAIAVLNAIGDVLLVTRVGIAGAAIATTSAIGVGALLLVIVVSKTGIEFAPLWRYAIPALILVPAVVVLLQLGPSAGGVVIVLTVAVGLLVVAWFVGAKSGHLNPFGWFGALGSALTLSEPPVAPHVRAE